MTYMLAYLHMHVVHLRLEGPTQGISHTRFAFALAACDTPLAIAVLCGLGDEANEGFSRSASSRRGRGAHARIYGLRYRSRRH